MIDYLPPISIATATHQISFIMARTKNTARRTTGGIAVVPVVTPEDQERQRQERIAALARLRKLQQQQSLRTTYPSKDDDDRKLPSRPNNLHITSPTSCTFFTSQDNLSNHPSLVNVLRFLDIQSLVSLSSTCRILRKLIIPSASATATAATATAADNLVWKTIVSNEFEYQGVASIEVQTIWPLTTLTTSTTTIPSSSGTTTTNEIYPTWYSLARTAMNIIHKRGKKVFISSEIEEEVFDDEEWVENDDENDDDNMEDAECDVTMSSAENNDEVETGAVNDDLDDNGNDDDDDGYMSWYDIDIQEELKENQEVYGDDDDEGMSQQPVQEQSVCDAYLQAKHGYKYFLTGRDRYDPFHTWACITRHFIKFGCFQEYEGQENAEYIGRESSEPP